MNRRMTRMAAAALAAIAIGSLAIGSSVAAHSDGDHLSRHNRHLLHEVREATEKFTSLTKAAAAGYGQPPAPAPLHECISSFDDTGAMGFHYINGALLDATISARHPEVLVYAPDKHGRKHLVGLEYVVFQADWKAVHGDTMPKLFGQMFMATGSPNRFGIPPFFSLHVWLFKHNPAGMFAPFNTRVSCAGADAASNAASTSSSTSSSTSGRVAAAAVSAVAAAGTDATATRRWACRVPAATA